jgi:hypothetical protein
LIIYGVHRFGWGNVGEIELLTAQLGNAERLPRRGPVSGPTAR